MVHCTCNVAEQIQRFLPFGAWYSCLLRSGKHVRCPLEDLSFSFKVILEYSCIVSSDSIFQKGNSFEKNRVDLYYVHCLVVRQNFGRHLGPRISCVHIYHQNLVMFNASVMIPVVKRWSLRIRFTNLSVSLSVLGICRISDRCVRRLHLSKTFLWHSDVGARNIGFSQ
jgi:hypothetical protein